MLCNVLSAETSPYLLQHKDNPVHWRPWGTEALAIAQEQDKPILLSIGYAACHWCHVMAHESFEDPSIATLMNESFVNVKVDREERPDLDAIYQSALALMGEHGGWPLTMFLTPRGEPFWGGTYFPPTPRYGRPSFPQVLEHMAQAYRHDREKVGQAVQSLREALGRLSHPEPGTGLSTQTMDDAAASALRLIDPIRGGTAGAPKFPQPVLFRLIWRAYRRTGSALFRDAVTLTLDQMSQGGIYDHLGGGFARYATDVAWLVPHFEKMLYDNALLVELLSEVWQVTGSPLYAARVTETLDWAHRSLRIDAPDGVSFAFASAYDADSEGVEGKYYVWDEADIERILGADAVPFKRRYDVTARGNWEHATILNRSLRPQLGDDREEAFLAACRHRLLAEREKRIAPGRDDKILADWNGLMIAALAQASTTFDQPQWLDWAESAFRFIVTHMTEGGRFRHSWCAGKARHAAVLDDYANMARAALFLFERTAHASYLDQARQWVQVTDRHHWDEGAGGYFFSADDTTDVITRTKSIADNAVPSGNGTMVEVLARLFFITGETRYRDRAEALIRLFSGDKPQYLLSVPGLLTAAELLDAAVQVVLIGEAGDPRTAAMRRAALTAPLALRVFSHVTTDRPLPAGHPAAGKTAIDGRPTVYVCVGPTCSSPLSEPEPLQAFLASL
jgi:hypothetical protein